MNNLTEQIHMKKTITDENSGEILCACGCGTVMEEQMADPSSELHAKENERTQTYNTGRSFSKRRFHDDDLGSQVGLKGEDLGKHGAKLRYTSRLLGNEGENERVLSRTFPKIDNFASRLSMPLSVSEDAKLIVRKFLKASDIKGRSLDSLVAASLYVASKQQNRGKRPMKDIGKSLGVNLRTVFKVVQKILIHVDLPNYSVDLDKDVRYYVNRICNQLHISTKVEKKVYALWQKVYDSKVLEGRGPHVIAAALVYQASPNTSQDEIARAAKCTGVALRTCDKRVRNHGI